MTDPRIEQKARERANKIFAWVKGGGTPLDDIAEAHLADILLDDLQSAVAEEREENCKAVCEWCEKGYELMPAGYHFVVTGGDGAFPECKAAKIRARGQKETA